jgi:hypothetical protein
MYRHHGYNYVGIPAFKDYAHIKAHYESVVPIRGRLEQVRPIGRRRYDWYEIRENQVAIDLSPENPLGTFAKSYACRLYHTDCVEFFPNNDIVVRVNRWKGPTTMGMLTYSLQAHGSIVSASGKWYFRNRKGEDFVLPTGKGEEMLLRLDDEGAYRPTVIPKEYKYKAKRKEMNQVVKVYQDFMEYARNMLSIDNKIVGDFHKLGFEELGFKSSHLTGNGYWSRDAMQNRSVLLQKVIHAQVNNDLEAMYKLACYCAYSFGRYYYNNGYVCDPQSFVKGFKDVLKYVYKDRVFEVVEQPQGVAFFDRNAKYVS